MFKAIGKYFRLAWDSVRSRIVHYLVPITDSTEFKALYPMIVVALGVLAAFHTDNVRTVVAIVTLMIIVVGSSVVIFLDSRKIRLNLRWNLLFFSYYRPFLIKLSSRIARSLDRKHKVDILTYRTGHFFMALEEAGADFEQVSGERLVNMASFDIEYIPALRAGVDLGGTQYRLIPLSDFWPGESFFNFHHRIPDPVKDDILQRLDAKKMYALPIGWGLIGVSVIGPDLSSIEALEMITEEVDGKRGVSFDKLIAHKEEMESLGYQLICYDLWSPMVQMVSLNYTGHMTVSGNDADVVRSKLSELYRILRPDDIIADPVLLRARLKRLQKTVVIGGSTWMGIQGTLAPIALPSSGTAYGGFCECFGIIAEPKKARHGIWQEDAVRLVSWLTDNLCREGARGYGLDAPSSVLSSFFPGLLRAARTEEIGDKGKMIPFWRGQPMQIDQNAKIVFRQFATNGDDPATRWREIWMTSKKE